MGDAKQRPPDNGAGYRPFSHVFRAEWAQGFQIGGERLSQCLTLVEISKVATSVPAGITKSGTAWVCIPDENGTPVLFAQAGPKKMQEGQCGCAQDVFENGKSRMILDCSSDSLCTGCNLGSQVGSCVCLPIRAGSTSVAVLAVGLIAKGSESMLPELLPMLEVFRNQVGYVWQRVLAEEELKILTQAVDQSPVSVVITNAKGEITYVNPVFSSITGYSKEEALGQNPRILKSGEQPDSLYRVLWKTLDSGKVWHGEFSNKRKNGERFWEQASISPIRNPKGETTHYVAVKEDITERRRAADTIMNMAQFAELNPAPVFRLNTEGELLISNRPARWLLDLSNMPRGDRGRYPNWVYEGVDQINQGKSSVQFEAEFENRHYLFTFRKPVDSDEINVYGADITARKQSEKQLAAARDAANSANKAKSDFLASMSHELRTPLNAIIGFSQVLEEKYFGDLNERQSQYVNDILESGRHLLSLINDILDLSKIEAGKMELELSSANLGQLVSGSMVMVKEKCMKHGISLEFNLSPDLKDQEMILDERRIKQVMFNLLSNASKFTPDGGRIDVLVGMVPDSTTDALVSVKDSGIGIAPEDQESVFADFYQVSSDLSAKTPGTGLGLPITRKIVEMHGGAIWVESEGEGKGSCFSFHLPIRAGKKRSGV